MTLENGEEAEAGTPECHLLSAPPELLDTVLSWLSPHDLAIVSGACKTLRDHATSDVLWQPHVQRNIGSGLTSPSPFSSYYELYAAFDLQWFLTRHKIWFSDRDLTGQVLIARYDHRRGCIEGYRLLAQNPRPKLREWSANPEVRISEFKPRVRLHLDKPVLAFRKRPPGFDGGFATRPDANRFSDEIPMELDDRLDAMFSNFSLAVSLNKAEVEQVMADEFPYNQLWPPPAIPANDRITGHWHGMEYLRPLGLPLQGLVPQTRSEASQSTFRIRKWLEMAGSPAAPGGDGTAGVRIGEELISYSSLDPAVYTPTSLKPWRGIWVGDYNVHGCEFLLVHQPDDPPATDAELGLQREEGESEQQWEKRQHEGRLHRGKMEAIKLTGDPHVPRGECSWIADDLGPQGFIGISLEPPFMGARTVRSRGHVAGRGFREANYIDTELFLVSHDVLAQHWVEFKLISYYKRVDIDELARV